MEFDFYHYQIDWIYKQLLKKISYRPGVQSNLPARLVFKNAFSLDFLVHKNLIESPICSYAYKNMMYLLNSEIIWFKSKLKILEPFWVELSLNQ